MAIEGAFNFISDLEPLYPLSGDGLNQADDHMRGIKNSIKGSFPNFAGIAMTATEAELNVLDGILASTAELNLLQGKSLASADNVIDNFPAGTLMLFQQQTAPTGWTRQAVHNNKALRVVDGVTWAGSGGSNAFTTALNAAVTSSATAPGIPAHTHSSGTLSANSNGNHTHTHVTTVGGGTPASSNLGLAEGTSKGTDTSSSNGAHTHTISGNTGSTGSGSSHTHTTNVDVQYVDIIIASKD